VKSRIYQSNLIPTVNIMAGEEDRYLGVEDGKQYNPQIASEDEASVESEESNDTDGENDDEEQAEVELGSQDTDDEVDVEDPDGLDSDSNEYEDGTDLEQRNLADDDVDEDNGYGGKTFMGARDPDEVADDSNSEEEVDNDEEQNQDADSGDEESTEDQGNNHSILGKDGDGNDSSEDDEESDVDSCNSSEIAEEDRNESNVDGNNTDEVENDTDEVENDTDEGENDTDEVESDSDEDEDETDEEELGLSILMGPTIPDDELDAVDFIPRESEQDDFNYVASDEEEYRGNVNVNGKSEVTEHSDVSGYDDFNQEEINEVLYNSDLGSEEAADDEVTNYVNEEVHLMEDGVEEVDIEQGDVEDGDPVESDVEEDNVEENEIEDRRREGEEVNVFEGEGENAFNEEDEDINYMQGSSQTHDQENEKGINEAHLNNDRSNMEEIIDVGGTSEVDNIEAGGNVDDNKRKRVAEEELPVQKMKRVASDNSIRQINKVIE